MLAAWVRNEKFPLSFLDHSTDFSVKSQDKGAIRRSVSAKINGANCFLCLIGNSTYKSEWVCWEIEKAKERNKPIIAVKIRRHYKSPKPIIGSGAKWVRSFKFESIKKAIEEL